ncbi:ADP-ribose pyrophosphatase [Paenibacillus uliginis N3/975]|uniref:ADP-ribose pyrophosphatase n=1 Tax=Paenibacillus uliginis N3/975 TaxID=1313296 RepID=A0A1X7H9F8_9BACL|nr:NUDIX domain-containing protein [Paenibacillus uliginis]SMF82139.1 ADP-ribose pyrophosphatase [Paenibacillus uliginis N3/975]
MSVYHRDVRQYIGKRTTVGVKAAVIVQNGDGEILLLKRQGKEEWGLPIGSMKPGESMEDAASRELWEESGLIADDMRLIDLLSGPQYLKKNSGGDEVYYVIGVYAAIGLRSAIELPFESELSLKYYDLEKLPIMEPISVHLMEKIKKQIR